MAFTRAIAVLESSQHGPLKSQSSFLCQIHISSLLDVLTDCAGVSSDLFDDRDARFDSAFRLSKASGAELGPRSAFRLWPYGQCLTDGAVE